MPLHSPPERRGTRTSRAPFLWPAPMHGSRSASPPQPASMRAAGGGGCESWRASGEWVELRHPWVLAMPQRVPRSRRDVARRGVRVVGPCRAATSGEQMRVVATRAGPVNGVVVPGANARHRRLQRRPPADRGRRQRGHRGRAPAPRRLCSRPQSAGSREPIGDAACAAASTHGHEPPGERNVSDLHRAIPLPRSLKRTRSSTPTGAPRRGRGRHPLRAPSSERGLGALRLLTLAGPAAARSRPAELPARPRRIGDSDAVDVALEAACETSAGALRLAHRALEAHAAAIGYARMAWISHARERTRSALGRIASALVEGGPA